MSSRSKADIITSRNRIAGAGLLLAIISLIGLGFNLDGITEYGHHACFITAGLLIGVGIGKLKK
jgi:hypothetical protein